MSMRDQMVICAILAMLNAAEAQAASPPKNKPQPPVQVAITAAQTGVTQEAIKPGDVVELIITAESHIDTDEMTISADIPSGAMLIAGSLKKVGPAKKGEKISMPITVRVPQKGIGEIKVRVAISGSDDTAFTAASRYSLGPVKVLKPAHRAPVKKDSKGREVIEYR